MVKVILQIYPVVPAADEAERTAKRPIGRNVDAYHETIRGCDDLVRACDDLGLWGVATIEHHFHSEGYELGPNPGILNTHWAAITNNIRVGALGYVMSTQNPIRVAEETAIVDHLTDGRYFVGFARGYQDRWTNIIGQHLGTRATHSTGDADDVINRDIFEEQVDMVIDAWTQDSIDHNSNLWQIPFPYDEGVDWWMAPATERLGAPGEIGDDGRVHRVSVVPAPYTQPHPLVFMASSGSPRTLEYCGSKGFIPTYFTNIEKGAEYDELYRAAARKSGFDFEPGQNQNTVRWLQIADTHEEALESAAMYDSEIQKNFYNLLHHARGSEEALPINTPVTSFVDVLDASDQHAIGTVGEVTDQLVRQWTEMPAEYLTIILHYAQQPLDSSIKTLERFMSEVKPAIDAIAPDR
ncbi:MAG: LLM class flavin-dependent oxidoreductase [Acidimicrobiia bacterium]|nr:LLM class flavin-dependent oxidoreductase [Acidimicrobiia bacterium]